MNTGPIEYVLSILFFALSTCMRKQDVIDKYSNAKPLTAITKTNKRFIEGFSERLELTFPRDQFTY